MWDDKEEKTLNVAGSSSVVPFAVEWAERYMEDQPGTRVHIQGEDSSEGLQLLRKGDADIAMLSRLLTPEEEKEFDSQVVAWDCIVVAVHVKNSVENVTFKQLQDIYTGKITNWKDLPGGEDAPITLIGREPGSGTRQTFDDLILKGKPVSPSLITFESGDVIRDMIAMDPYSIGYVSMGQIGSEVVSLDLDGVEPTEENILSGKYPMIRPFILVFKKERKPERNDFVQYVVGKGNSRLLRIQGLVVADRNR